MNYTENDNKNNNSQIMRFYSIINYIEQLCEERKIEQIELDKRTFLQKIIDKIKNKKSTDYSYYITKAISYIQDLFNGISYDINFLYSFAEWILYCKNEKHMDYLGADVFTIDIDQDERKKLSMRMEMKDRETFANNIIEIVVIVDNITVNIVNNGVSSSSTTAFEMSKDQIQLIAPIRDTIRSILRGYLSVKLEY